MTIELKLVKYVLLTRIHIYFESPIEEGCKEDMALP